MRHFFNYCRLLSNAQCHCNPCVLFCYAVHLFFIVLKDCLTTAHYCAIMLMFSQFKLHPNIAVIVIGLQSGWLRKSLSSFGQQQDFLQTVLTGSGTHPASYWAPYALSLGLKWPRHEADSSTPSSAISWEYTQLYLLHYSIYLHGMHREEFTFTRYEILKAMWMKIHFV